MWCVILQTDGRTPLYVASQNGHIEVVRVLFGSGAAVNQAKVTGVTFGVGLCVSGWC